MAKCGFSPCDREAPAGFRYCCEECTQEDMRVPAGTQPINVPVPGMEFERRKPQCPYGPGHATADELSKIIGVSYFSIHEWRKKGLLEARKEPGKREFWFNIEAVRAALRDKSEREMTQCSPAQVETGPPAVDALISGVESKPTKVPAQTETVVAHALQPPPFRPGILAPPPGVGVLETLAREAEAAEKEGDRDLAYGLMRIFMKCWRKSEEIREGNRR